MSYFKLRRTISNYLKNSKLGNRSSLTPIRRLNISENRRESSRTKLLNFKESVKKANASIRNSAKLLKIPPTRIKTSPVK
jgi:hypothetical protein